MNYDLLAIDLDGTFLRNDHSPHPENIKALQRAADAGLDLILATGRGYGESHAALAALPVNTPIINLSGAIICDSQSGETLHRWDITPQLVYDASKAIFDAGYAPLLFKDTSVTNIEYLVIGEDRLVQSTREWFKLGQTCIQYEEELDISYMEDVLRIGLVHEKEAVEKVVKIFRANWQDDLLVHHFSFGDYLMEAFHPDANKWNALKWYFEQKGYDPARVAAVGDQVNDNEMIKNAGLGIAMANAVPEIKSLAKVQTKSNEEAGVAHAIDMILNGEW